ncbi:spore coat protein [Carboxydochorda subterranea]|uniref:Spore coat protein n=1 Tax=Carboxydichorda subterranea TaxID=3109565 RepID=A0ABZ1C0W5_9FIRM|nr:spore coat protein [Limnochorda sp. L945t]WRP18717.1 spore coat protein [Limnochorda sp. L945t]
MPFTDKEIASDVLDMLKHRATGLTKAAIECSDINLRNTLLQMRQFDEGAQWELYRLMEQKGWYLPSGRADATEIQKVRQYFQGVPVQAGAGYMRDGGGLRV